jgi:methionyl-tRNA formyltransferase
MNLENRKLKIIFWGTSEFAVPSLEALFKNPEIELAAIITEPDKRAGRKLELKKSPVKIFAEEKKLKLFQPENLKDKEFLRELKKTKTDVAVLAAYGRKIPIEILKIPKKGFLNLHPSLLPKYRGPSPIQTAILNNDKEIGVSIIILDEKIDHGPILAQKKLKIEEDETAPQLSEKLAKLGAKLLIQTIKKYNEGRIIPQPQNDEKATYTKLFSRADGKIDWKNSAKKIERMVRAFYPWPSAWTEIKNIGRIKITKSSILSLSSLSNLIAKSDIEKLKKIPVGEFFEINKKLAVKCGHAQYDGDLLIIEKLIPEGKKEMTGEEFLRGYKVINKV